MTRLGNSVLVAVLVISGPAAAQQAVQWRVEDGGNGHWYAAERSQNPLAWTHARDLAAADGGYLATLPTAEENAWVFEHVASVQAIWNGPQGPYLGGFRDQASSCGADCGWQWVTGEPWGFTTWDQGNPSGGGEAYLHFGNTVPCWCPGPHWNDIADINSGWEIRTYIVEWSADCNNDGVVDYGQCRDGTLADFNGNSVPDCCERGEPCVAGHFPTQWRTADGGNGHWYQWLGWGVEPTYDGAVSRATGRGGHLATVVSEAESLFALSVVTEDSCEPQYGGAVWLGARQQPGAGSPADGWSWVTGEPWSYVRWRADEPNDFQGVQEDRLVFSKIGGYWLDVPDHPVFSPPCVFGLLVEWSADCNGDGLVDYGQVLRGELADADADGVPDVCDNGSGGAGELVVNGGFDSGTSGWTFGSIDGAGGWRATGGNPAGMFILNDGGGASDPTIEQVVTGLSPGGLYRLSGDFKGGSLASSPVGAVSFAVDVNGATVFSAVATDLTTWRHFAVDVGAAGSSAVLRLRAEINGTDNDFVIDNISLVMLPPPRCMGDVSGNGLVNGIDLAAVLDAWGSDGQGKFDCDINNDGLVNGADLSIVLSDWGACP